MLSNHLILCHLLLLPPSIFPSIRVFSNESALCIRWPNYWSFSFNISPSNEYPGLISFRMDWLAQGLALRIQTEKLHVCKFKHTHSHTHTHTHTHSHTQTHTHTHTHTHTGWQAGWSPAPPPQLSSVLVKLSFTASPPLCPVPQIALGRQLSRCRARLSGWNLSHPKSSARSGIGPSDPAFLCPPLLPITSSESPSLPPSEPSQRPVS